MQNNHLHLWNEEIFVHNTKKIFIENTEFLLHYVTASDDTYALLSVSTFYADKNINDLSSFLELELARNGLRSNFIDVDKHIFLESILPISTHLLQIFSKKSLGIIILINDKEAGAGKLSLNEMHPKKGDKIEIIYRISL